jgi:hypothetical protein
MAFVCKRCKKRTDIRRTKRNPNNKVVQNSRKKAEINASSILTLKPNVRLCPDCSSELLRWLGDPKAHVKTAPVIPMKRPTSTPSALAG